MKRFLALVVASAAASTFGVGTAQAATCLVPTLAYPTIQSAVNDPVCTIINVAPGAYTENVIISRTLTLNGAQAGNPVFTRVSGAPLESTVNGANPIGANAVISIRAASVTVDGFTLRNPVSTGAAIGVGVKTAGNAALITNNFIDTITTPDLSVNGTAQAVYLENGPDGVSILDNDLKNVVSLRSAKGVLVGDNGAANAALNTLIQGNSISNITSNNRGSYGISVANATTGVTGLTIQDNTIMTLTAAPAGWIHAIGLEGNTPGVVVNGNSITNFVTTSPDAIAVWFEVNPSFSTAQVNENNFNVTIAAYGIAVHPAIPGSGDVDGTCNWWGDPNGPGPIGPGLGAKVGPRVDYTPWLIAPAPGGGCLGGVPNTPGKVNGGGQVEGDPLFSPLGDLISLPALVPSLAGPQSNATFGFSVKCCAPTGNLEYQDHGADVRIKSESITRLVISGGTCGPNTHATFTGTASVIQSSGTTTQDFQVDVDDCAEPGTMDTFGIKTFGVPPYSNGPSTLAGGNIQIH